ncbi:hypothetical protein HMI54_009708, partial [Coelomomyces lativittatus]
MRRKSNFSICSTDSNFSIDEVKTTSSEVENKFRGRDRMAELKISNSFPQYKNKFIDVRVIQGSGYEAQKILQTISEINEMLKDFPSKINELVSHQERANDLRIHEGVLEKNRYILSKVSQNLKFRLRQCKADIDTLGTKIELLPKSNADYTMCSNQLMVLRRQLLINLNTFYKIEMEYSTKQKNQLLKELRIVHPEATEDDLKGMNKNLFRDDILFSRTNEHEVLNMMRGRHEEIQHLEKSVEEVAELFHELSNIIQGQDLLVMETLEEVEAGGKEIGKAVKRRKNTIRLCWFFWLAIALILLSVAIYFGATYFGTSKSVDRNPELAKDTTLAIPSSPENSKDTPKKLPPKDSGQRPPTSVKSTEVKNTAASQPQQQQPQQQQPQQQQPQQQQPQQQQPQPRRLQPPPPPPVVAGAPSAAPVSSGAS